MSETRPPLFSCLCVTEGRAAFMPWLLWCFDRQQWPHRELVIIDSSRDSYRSDRKDVRVITMPPGTGVAAKRNRALAEARGEWVAWFDDDDWQHPERLSRLAEALTHHDSAGPTGAWFYALNEGGVQQFGGHRRQMLFNGAGFRRAAVTTIRFPEQVTRASDTQWMRDINTRLPRRGQSLPDDTLFFWLCHGDNLSNPESSRRCQDAPARLRARVGDAAWGDTDRQMQALRERIAASRARPKMPASPVKTTAATRQRQSAPDSPQAVALVIKATVLDAPYLETMVRHMVAQARYPFADSIVLVDRPASFTGKYSDREAHSAADLERALDALTADGTIRRVLDVPRDENTVHAINERYFPGHGTCIGTHAATGGPIFATLYGMEAAAYDRILQMDADVFFHAADERSWVAESLEKMAADPSLWLMMTHPGPPAGPPGASLAGPNARRASWDSALRVWRFRSATTRYFLCDRRQLRGRLSPQVLRGRCEPLERCISRALAAGGGFRGALGDPGSWHLHAWSHAAPFPAWAAALADAVAAGEAPPCARGAYDLRLDRPDEREAWRRLLASRGAFAQEAASQPEARPKAAPAAGPAAVRKQSPTNTLPVSVVIPVRNRACAALRRTLQSLRWQTAGQPAEILIVDHGSDSDQHTALQGMAGEARATLLRIGSPEAPWNKPLALNHGIRATRSDSDHVLVMDADILLAPDFFQVALDSPGALVLCRCRDLPQSARLPEDPARLQRAFSRLAARSRLRPDTSTGGVQWAQRDFFFSVQGYDEDLIWWGAMDNDMVRRARNAGLPVVWADQHTGILHQWHPRKHAILRGSQEQSAAREAWQRNHRLMQERTGELVRNGSTWGGLPA